MTRAKFVPTVQKFGGDTIDPEKISFQVLSVIGIGEYSAASTSNIGFHDSRDCERRYVLSGAWGFGRGRLAAPGGLPGHNRSRNLLSHRNHGTGSRTDRSRESHMPALRGAASVPQLGDRNQSGHRCVGRTIGRRTERAANRQSSQPRLDPSPRGNRQRRTCSPVRLHLQFPLKFVNDERAHYLQSQPVHRRTGKSAPIVDYSQLK